MTKNKNKLILGFSLALAPITFAIPLVVTSCTSSSNNNNEETEPYTQFEYQKKMDLYLNDNKDYVFENNGVKRQYASFQDDDVNSPTYKGWYLLLRDGNNNNKLIASFCGWSKSYLSGKEVYDKINSQGYLIPNEISLPKNSSLVGWNKNKKIRVEAIGYDKTMMNYSEIASANSLSLDDFAKDKLFFSEEYARKTLPILPYTNTKMDLSLNPIKYIFNEFTFTNTQDIKPKEINITFPESLIFLEKNSLYVPIYSNNVTFDFSKTKLVEIKYLEFYNDENAKIILPDTCKRITYIWGLAKVNGPNFNLEINLENVLYYGEEALQLCTFKNKTLVINKDAHFFWEPDNNSYWSFPQDVEVVDLEGNVLKPAINNEHSFN
ncbi:MAG: hypothetical protein K2K73_03230 [Ureaplasma sp.]|nr:hypothetical protein [Ureaplasma sp.]